MDLANEIRPESTSHYYWLDWLRFIAALLVVIGHARFQHFGMYSDLHIPCKGLWSETLFFIPRLASEAVTVFFVLSGYLVGGRTLERAISGKFDCTSYIIDRGVRIWLPLIPAVLFTWMVSALNGENINWAEGIGNIFAMQGVLVDPMLNNSALWSLSYEVWFYVAALGVGLFFNNRGKTAWIPMLLLTCVFVIFSSLGSNNLFIWLLGTLAYFLKPGRFRWTILIIGTLFAGIGGLFSALGVANASQKLSFAGNSSFHREYFLILLGLGVSISLPVIVRLRPRGPSLERINRYGSGLAAWSYSLYLIHRPILYLWSNFHDSNTTNQFNAYSIVMYLVKIGSCLAGGWLFWLLFEGRTDQVRRLLKKKCFLSN